MENLLPNKIKLTDTVDSLLLREDDLIGEKRAKYLVIAKDVWRSMNFGGIKDTKRVYIEVDKRTGSIALPGDCYAFSTLYVPSERGKLFALMQNKNLSEDLIDLSLNKSCRCECGCESELCANIQNYEVIETVVSAEMPDGSFQNFTKTARKRVNKDGTYQTAITEPVATYLEGEHVSTVLETRYEDHCKLEVSACGCVVQSSSNLNLVEDCCAFDNHSNECGRPVTIDCLDSGYNFSDDGKRIIIPNFPYKYVVLRYYADLKTKDIYVPILCKKLMMLKIQYEAIEMDLEFPEGKKQAMLTRISTAETNMMSDLSRTSLTQIYRTLNPKRNMV